jgi:hypothetical protein
LTQSIVQHLAVLASSELDRAYYLDQRFVRRVDSVYTELRDELLVWAKEFSMPSIRSPCWIRYCRKGCDAATINRINRHQHPKRNQSGRQQIEP